MGNLIFTRLIMKKYVESNLSRNESVVKKADFNCLYLLKTWLRGILFFWILFIPTIRAIIDTVYFLFYELAVTDKRIIGKEGIISTYVLDAPLNKIQNVSVVQPFLGKIFNYGTVRIYTAAKEFSYPGIKNPDNFKGIIMTQINQTEEDKIKQQASETANAINNK